MTKKIETNNGNLYIRTNNQARELLTLAYFNAPPRFKNVPGSAGDSDYHKYAPRSEWRRVAKASEAPFDYITADEKYDYRLFEYRGEWYDLQEFETTLSIYNPKDGVLDTLYKEGWQGYQTDSIGSGIVIKFSEDDGIIVGSFYVSTLEL